jgi:phosphohistidine phosphatase
MSKHSGGRAATPAPILLVRHGKAEDDHPIGDGARALTETGRELFREHARTVAELVRLEGIATSPLVRAVQTAEILADACGLTQVLVRRELDLSSASARSIEALGRELGPGWALVGHNPSLGEALAHLLGRPEPLRFRKGAVVALAPGPRGERPWDLAWYAAPGRKVKQELED